MDKFLLSFTGLWSSSKILFRSLCCSIDIIDTSRVYKPVHVVLLESIRTNCIQNVSTLAIILNSTSTINNLLCVRYDYNTTQLMTNSRT